MLLLLEMWILLFSLSNWIKKLKKGTRQRGFDNYQWCRDEEEEEEEAAAQLANTVRSRGSKDGGRPSVGWDILLIRRRRREKLRRNFHPSEWHLLYWAHQQHGLKFKKKRKKKKKTTGPWELGGGGGDGGADAPKGDTHKRSGQWIGVAVVKMYSTALTQTTTIQASSSSS